MSASNADEILVKLYNMTQELHVQIEKLKNIKIQECTKDDIKTIIKAINEILKKYKP